MGRGAAEGDGGADSAARPSTMLRMVPLPMELRSTGRMRRSCAGPPSGEHSLAKEDAMTIDATAEGKTRRLVTLPARPEPIRVAVDETAVIVIDMQNAYASPGGYLDLAGFDIGGA